LEDEETLTAYHEAGHAVIGYALGGVVDSIQLGGEANEKLPRRFGECRIRWGRVDPHADWQVQCEVLTVLAGPAAEMVYQGEKFHPGGFGPWQDDWRRAWQIGQVFADDAVRRSEVLWLLVLRLEQLLRQDRCWPAIAALADELLAHEFLDQDQAEQVLGFWLR
jgi:hypothetical protein